MIISSLDFSPKFQTHISTCQPATIQTFYKYFKSSMPESDIIIIFRKSTPFTVFSVLVCGTSIHQLRNQAVILALFLFLTVKQPISNLVDPKSQTTLKFLNSAPLFCFRDHLPSLIIGFSVSTYLTQGKFIKNELFYMLIHIILGCIMVTFLLQGKSSVPQHGTHLLQFGTARMSVLFPTSSITLLLIK